jgi:hypothetical protein
VCVYTQRDVDYTVGTVKECRLDLGAFLDARQKLDGVTDGKLLSRYICLLCTNLCTNKLRKFKITPTCFRVDTLSSASLQFC